MALSIVNIMAVGLKKKLAQSYPVIGKLIPDATLTTVIGFIKLFASLK